MIRTLRQEAGHPNNPIHILPEGKTDLTTPTLCGLTFKTITRSPERDASEATCPECLARL